MLVHRKLIRSLTSYIEAINQVRNEIQGKRNRFELWFRGVSNFRYSLVPGIYRKRHSWEYNARYADTLKDVFIQKAQAFLPRSKTFDKWSWMQISQHHGLPTRLLDWSQGHLIALYFSVQATNNKDIGAVYILEPILLNKISADRDSILFTDSMTKNSDDDIVDDFLLDHSETLPVKPIAVEPPFTDSRMTSQKSCFTVHGSARQGLEVQFRKSELGIHQLKITNKAEIKAELFRAGISESTLFPDMDGLAREIIYQFNII